MARIKVDNNSLKKAVQDIVKTWADQVTRDSRKYENVGKHEMQNAVRYLRTYDTGELDQGVFMKQDRQNNIITWNYGVNGVATDYYIYPRLGLGTSKEYGIRKFDVRAINKMLKRYKLKTKTNNAGSPRPIKGRDKNIPSEISI